MLELEPEPVLEPVLELALELELAPHNRRR